LSEKQKLRVLFHPKDHPWRTDSGYSIPSRYLIQGLYKDVDLGVFAPVGQKYKTEYYFPDLGIFSYEPTYSLVIPHKITKSEKDGVLQVDSTGSTEIDAGPSVPIFPGVSEDFGEQIVEEHFQQFQADCRVVLVGRYPELEGRGFVWREAVRQYGGLVVADVLQGRVPLQQPSVERQAELRPDTRGDSQEDLFDVAIGWVQVAESHAVAVRVDRDCGKLERIPLRPLPLLQLNEAEPLVLVPRVYHALPVVAYE
jgi:hypothetical protein